MKNEIITTQNSLTYDKSQVELIKNTVAKGATNDELNMFLYLSKQYGLDPFKREIWFTKYGNQTNIMTSRDGYLKYAQENPEFEGLISFVVHEGDTFEIDAADYKVSHKFGVKRGPVAGAWARCDRKGKKPFISYVEFSEYNQKNNIWNKYPSAMIQKVAEVFVLKRAFGINGLVTKEELSDETQEPQQPTGPKMMEKTQKEGIFKMAQLKGLVVGTGRTADVTGLKAFTMKNIGTPLEHLNFEQAQQLIEVLMTYEKEVEHIDAEILIEEEQEIINEIAPINDDDEVEI